MPIMIFTMLIVLVLAAGIIAVVVMGMEGAGRSQHPEIADAMARTARHLNGEGEPPRALIQLFDEIDEVPDLNMRELPGRLRSLRSAASARSARSAASAASAHTPEPVSTPGPEGVDRSRDDEVWAPVQAAPEASEIDESAARAMSAALAAPSGEGPVADPYGVLVAPDPEIGEVADWPNAHGDTVLRVHLPKAEPNS